MTFDVVVHLLLLVCVLVLCVSVCMCVCGFVVGLGLLVLALVGVLIFFCGCRGVVCGWLGLWLWDCVSMGVVPQMVGGLLCVVVFWVCVVVLSCVV